MRWYPSKLDGLGAVLNIVAAIVCVDDGYENDWGVPEQNLFP